MTSAAPSTKVPVAMSVDTKLKEKQMRITESQLRRIIREQMMGAAPTADRAPPRTIDYESFKQMFDAMGGAVYDEETMMQLYDDYSHRRITWGQVKDAAMLD